MSSCVYILVIIALLRLLLSIHGTFSPLMMLECLFDILVGLVHPTISPTPNNRSLGYHYKRSNHNQALAFKYELKAADQALSRGAFADGLDLMTSACALAVSEPEWDIAAEVLKLAVSDLQRLVTSLNRIPVTTPTSSSPTYSPTPAITAEKSPDKSPRTPRSARWLVAGVAGIVGRKRSGSNGSQGSTDSGSVSGSVSGAEADINLLSREQKQQQEQPMDSREAAALHDAQLKLTAYAALLRKAEAQLQQFESARQHSSASASRSPATQKAQQHISVDDSSRAAAMLELRAASDASVVVEPGDIIHTRDQLNGSATTVRSTISIASSSGGACEVEPVGERVHVEPKKARPFSLNWQPSYVLARGSNSTSATVSSSVLHTDMSASSSVKGGAEVSTDGTVGSGGGGGGGVVRDDVVTSAAADEPSAACKYPDGGRDMGSHEACCCTIS